MFISTQVLSVNLPFFYEVVFIPNSLSNPRPNMRPATFAPCELPTILVSFRMDVRDLPGNEMPCTKTQFEETAHSSHTHWE